MNEGHFGLQREDLLVALRRLRILRWIRRAVRRERKRVTLGACANRTLSIDSSKFGYADAVGNLGRGSTQARIVIQRRYGERVKDP